MITDRLMNDKYSVYLWSISVRRLDTSQSILMHKMLTVFLQAAAIAVNSARHWIHCFNEIMHSLDAVLHKPSTGLCTEH